jgi:hypothetical protein
VSANSASSQTAEMGRKLNVLIALSLRQLLGDKDFSAKGRRKHGTGDVVRYLAEMGLDAKDSRNRWFSDH